MAEAHTFLFCDLVGFTALTAAEGDHRAADVAVELCERTRPLLPAHSAEHIKSLGDSLMIRCEDPALAVQLGLRIVGELEAVDGFPPVRVGIHTGPAVTRDGDWYGTTVNLASRLCAAAVGGQVLASEQTVEAAGRLRAVELGEQRLHWLKNVTEPVAAHPVALRERETRRERLVAFGRRMAAGCPKHRVPTATPRALA
jgi:class 3 adenylate cyclase